MEAERTSIYWRPWNPVTGCSPRTCTTELCRPNCWARANAERFPQVTAGHGFTPTFHVDRLADPLHWRPERWKDVPLRLEGLPVVAVAYQGDLFDPGITDEQRAAVYGVMAAQPYVSFLTLTKDVVRRHAFHAWLPAECARRLAKYTGPRTDLKLTPLDHCVQMARRHDAHRIVLRGYYAASWPLTNVWEGASICTQADAVRRLSILLDTPASHRWLSVEPLLEQVIFIPDLLAAVDLVIVGPETGPRRRPCDRRWIASIVEQCRRAGVRCLVKGEA